MYPSTWSSTYDPWLDTTALRPSGSSVRDVDFGRSLSPGVTRALCCENVIRVCLSLQYIYTHTHTHVYMVKNTGVLGVIESNQHGWSSGVGRACVCLGYVRYCHNNIIFLSSLPVRQLSSRPAAAANRAPLGNSDTSFSSSVHGEGEGRETERKRHELRYLPRTHGRLVSDDGVYVHGCYGGYRPVKRQRYFVRSVPPAGSRPSSPSRTMSYTKWKGRGKWAHFSPLSSKCSFFFYRAHIID